MTYLKPDVRVPTIHLNGSSPKTLLADLESVLTPLNQAIANMGNVTPHGRDYYTQGEGVTEAAREDHFTRVKKLQSVAEELIAIARGIQRQQRDRT